MIFLYVLLLVFSIFAYDFTDKYDPANSYSEYVTVKVFTGIMIIVNIILIIYEGIKPLLIE